MEKVRLSLPNDATNIPSYRTHSKHDSTCSPRLSRGPQKVHAISILLSPILRRQKRKKKL